MAATGIGFRWLDILEKEFDKACIELDTSLAVCAEEDDTEAAFAARQKIASLSSCFAQLSHKAQTIFQNSAKLEAELVDMRAELVEARALVAAYEERDKTRGTVARGTLDAVRARAEVAQLARENAALRDTILTLHADLYSARLAAKYLDKELAGRIQQLQLLGREMRAELRDSLWRQLEAEILLQRHKTVVRACRSGKPCAPAPAADPRGVGAPRLVSVRRDNHQGLGISITGGREHGVPILISELEAGGPAALTRALHVGDAILAVNDIDLTQACHKEAVTALQSASGDCALYVQFVACDDENEQLNDDNHYRFPLYPEEEDVCVREADGSGATPTAPRTPDYTRTPLSDGVNSGSGYESPTYPDKYSAAAPAQPYPDYNAINNNLSILDMDDNSIKIETQTAAPASPVRSPALASKEPPRSQRHLGRYRGLATGDITSNESLMSTPVHSRRPHTKKKKVKPLDWRAKGAYRPVDDNSSDEPTPPLDRYVDVEPADVQEVKEEVKESGAKEERLPSPVQARKVDNGEEESWKKKAFRIGSARRVAESQATLTNGDKDQSPRVSHVNHVNQHVALLTGDGDPDFGTPV